MRPVVLSNGHLWIGFDDRGHLRDLCYPHVGQPNHAGGWPSRFGIALNHEFTWIHGSPWVAQRAYRASSPVAITTLTRPDRACRVRLTDTVLPQDNVFIRRVDVSNAEDQPLDVRLFFHLDLSLYESDLGDTVLYDPELSALVHYKRETYVLLSGSTDDRDGLWQWTCGFKRFRNWEGTWRDAEDGRMEMNGIAQGSCDSTGALTLTVPAHGESQAYFWMAVGNSGEDVARLHQSLCEHTPETYLARADRYWTKWLETGRPVSQNRSLAVRSRLIARAFLDADGGIVAGVDSDVLEFNRDHYGYVWPRDASLIAASLIAEGAAADVVPYFRFIGRLLSPEGALAHKYNPDGSPGSTWHPRFYQGQTIRPIQTDETALVLIALERYWQSTGDLKLVDELWTSLINPAAQFLATYRDRSGLSGPSWDLWEERYGIHAWTIGATFAGLLAASSLAKAVGRERGQWEHAAEEIGNLARQRFWLPDCNRFGRSLDVWGQPRGPDLVPDASIYGLVAFGVVTPHSLEAEATRQALLHQLWVPKVGGIARYVGDRYYRSEILPQEVPGNPWVVTTCWLAAWSAMVGDQTTAERLLRWVEATAGPTQVLPEQIDAITGLPVSVCPLAWSHATYLLTLDAMRHDVPYWQWGQETLAR